MAAMKRKRPTYDEDEKLRHQAEKALMREAKRVKTHLFQQAIRKHKAAIQKQEARRGTAATGSVPDAVIANEPPSSDADVGARATPPEGACPAAPQLPGRSLEGQALSRASSEVSLIKDFSPSTVVKICLRRLGLAHTGFAGEEEVKVEGSARVQALVQQIFEHKRVTTVMDELQERVTQRRREKLAEKEGRPLPRRRMAEKAQARSVAPTKRSRQHSQGNAQDTTPSDFRAGSKGSAFVSLSGEAPSDEEWASSFEAARQWSTGKSASVTNARRGKKGTTPAPEVASTLEERRRNEPGWAGADRQAGWGRGGGRAKSGAAGRGRGIGRGKGRGPHAADAARRGSDGADLVSGVATRREATERPRKSQHTSSRSSSHRDAGGDATDVGHERREGLRAREEGLHGSWAAKRALKEKEASATKAFSGKRITFGDYD